MNGEEGRGVKSLTVEEVGQLLQVPRSWVYEPAVAPTLKVGSADTASATRTPPCSANQANPLGHSDLETTLNIYTHAIPDSRRRAVEKVAAILFPNVPKFTGPAETGRAN